MSGIAAAIRPTEFRGCIWDDGWEFDAPCVIYYPWKYRRVGIGGNNSHLDRMVEDICWDIVELVGPDMRQSDLDDEMRWRGWGRRFGRRRRAEHVVFRVEWDGDDYEIIERTAPR